eukprot:4654852-Amphidinium_carterae.1
MEAELQQLLRGHESLQLPMVETFTDSSTGMTMDIPDGGNLELSWHHVFGCLKSLEAKVKALQAEQQCSDDFKKTRNDGLTDDKYKRMEEMLAAIAAQLPVLVKGDLCTLPEVQCLLKEERQSLRA